MILQLLQSLKSQHRKLQSTMKLILGLTRQFLPYNHHLSLISCFKTPTYLSSPVLGNTFVDLLTESQYSVTCSLSKIFWLQNLSIVRLLCLPVFRYVLFILTVVKYIACQAPGPMLRSGTKSKSNSRPIFLFAGKSYTSPLYEGGSGVTTKILIWTCSSN